MDTPVKNKREELRTELLEAEAKRAEMKMAYAVHGVESDFRTRATLDAKIARLTSELHKYNLLEREEKLRVKEIHSKQLMTILVDKMGRLGLGKVVEEARSESLAALEEAGLLDAYRSKA